MLLTTITTTEWIHLWWCSGVYIVCTTIHRDSDEKREREREQWWECEGGRETERHATKLGTACLYATFFFFVWVKLVKGTPNANRVRIVVPCYVYYYLFCFFFSSFALLNENSNYILLDNPNASRERGTAHMHMISQPLVRSTLPHRVGPQTQMQSVAVCVCVRVCDFHRFTLSLLNCISIEVKVC